MRPPFAKYWDERAKHCSGCWYDMAGVDGTVCPECGRDLAKHESWIRDGRWSVWPLVGAAGLVAAIPPAVFVLCLLWMKVLDKQGASLTPALIALAASALIPLLSVGVLVLLAHRMTRHFWNNFARGAAVGLTFFLVGLASAELSRWLLLPVVAP